MGPAPDLGSAEYWERTAEELRLDWIAQKKRLAEVEWRLQAFVDLALNYKGSAHSVLAQFEALAEPLRDSGWNLVQHDRP